MRLYEEEVVIVVNNIVANQKPIQVVGIDGLSRSGKTTFTKALQAELRMLRLSEVVFHLDDHIEVRNKRYGTGYEEWHEYYFLQWDVDYLAEYLFGALHANTEVVLNYYDNGLDQQASISFCIPEMCVIIVEGVFLQREEWRRYLDYVVYLDCSQTVRFSREQESTQSNLSKFQNRYWKAEDYYIQTVKPRSQADFIIQT